jgi:hypothetical protein
MPNLTFDFTWYRDSKGYKLVPAKCGDRKVPILDRPSSDIQPARVVRLDGKLESYRPKTDLWLSFITLQTEPSVVDFIKKWGPLTHAGLRGKGDLVRDVLDEAEEMKHVSMGKIILPRLLNKLVVTLIRENGELRLKVRPACLLDDLWLQFAQANSRVAKFKRCRQCDEQFAAGAGFGRRADAEFCSDECRKRFNSLARSRK